MQSTVTGKNQVTIPAALARQHGIAPGVRLDWSSGGEPDLLQVRILPEPRQLARSLEGSLRCYVADPAACLAGLIAARADEDPR